MSVVILFLIDILYRLLLEVHWQTLYEGTLYLLVFFQNVVFLCKMHELATIYWAPTIHFEHLEVDDNDTRR